MTRFEAVIAATVAAMAIGFSAVIHPAPILIFNASASVPIGFYRVQPVGTLHVADLVVVMSPAPLASFLAERGYLPKGVPLMKRVLALPGQAVCRSGRMVTVDGMVMGEALDHDRRGRDLPVWQGCRVVAAGEVFLMNRRSGDSFDGRYFGPLPASTVIGRATPIWTDPEP